MKFFSVVIVCILIISCLEKKANFKEQEYTKLKVLVWNILHGGKNENLPVDGRPAIIQIIKDSEADVVLMIETYGSAPIIAASLGFNYELLSSNLCIYSRYPITKKMLFKDQISPFNFGGVELSVDGKPVNVFDTWLHYLPDTRQAPITKTESEILAWENEGTRDDEIKTILKAISYYVENADSVSVIMGGDFNSHSHLDWTENTRGMYNHGNAVVNWSISKAMTDAGFTDTYRKIHPDPVKNIGTTWLGVSDKRGNLVFTRRDRIDYLYSKGKNLKIKDSESYVAPFSQEFTFRGKTYKNFPSDHGFVLTTFQLY
jgi:hypothetical protein